jgi:hypothetical protein
MTRPNAALALKQDDRPASLRRKPQERVKAADVATYLTEEQIQVAVAQYLDAKLPRDWRWHHPPNGGWRKKATAARLKAQGVKPGVPDICILRPNGLPIWIELKAFGGTLTLAQRDFMEWCIAAKHPFKVCRSVGEVEVFLKEFLA